MLIIGAFLRSRFVVAAALLVGFVYASAQTDSDDDVITIDSSIVVVNVAITDANGRAATGLEQKHFTILEDGTAQEISFFSPEETPFAAVILLDTSGSMESRVALARSAAITFLNGMRRTDSVAVIKFDSSIDVVQDFSSSVYLSDRFYELKANGMTVMNDAIFMAADMLSKRPEKRRAIVVLSDGEDTLSSKSSKKALAAAIAANATIYTVDMAPTGGPIAKPRNHITAELKNYAEKTGGTFVSTPGGPAMREAFARIVEELGSQYTLAYSPKSTRSDGKFRRIEVRVSKPGLTIRTRKGYNAPRAGK